MDIPTLCRTEQTSAKECVLMPYEIFIETLLGGKEEIFLVYISDDIREHT